MSSEVCSSGGCQKGEEQLIFSRDIVVLSFCKRKETLLVFAVIIPALILCTCCQREGGKGR